MLPDSGNPNSSSLTELAEAIAALRALPPSDAESRKAREAECAMLIQLQEQLLRDRELALKEQAQIVDTEMRRGELALKERTVQRDKWTNPLTVIFASAGTCRLKKYSATRKLSLVEERRCCNKRPWYGTWYVRQ